MKLRHYLTILLALAVLGGVSATVYLGGASDFGAMEVRCVDPCNLGVQIHRGNSVIDVGESPEALEPQDVVVTTTGPGLAQLNLESEERTVWLQKKTRLRIRSTTVVEAQQGSVLALAEDAPMEVRFDDVTARFSSAKFRIDRGIGSARAASFEGSVRLQSAGEPRLELPTLFQADIAAGDLPMAPSPYRVDPGDAFDTEHLSDVVALTRDLDDLTRGFARQVDGDSRPGLDYFASLTTADVSFMRRYLSRPVSDLLVAFTIAENDPDSSFKQAFIQAFDYLDAGASYGVAATILDVRTGALVAQLEGLIVDTGAVASDGGAGDATFAVGAAGDSGSSAAGGGIEDEGAGTSTVSGGVEGESNGDVDDCSDVVDCGVQDVEDQLPPGPGPGPGEEEDPPGNGVLPGDGDDGGLLDGGLPGN